jgi:hydrogenase maturation protein HypF
VLAEHLAGGAIHAAATQATRDVVLAGGCLANRVLREALSRGREAAGLRVHLPAAAGCGDAGLALGQAWIAACVSANLAVDAPAQPRASRLPSALQAH